MSTIRPAGSGKAGTASAFMRSIVAPRAGLLILSSVAGMSDWPTSDGEPEANLGHALGWTCEVRGKDILLLDPLGEGLIKCPIPELSPSWLDNVRHDQSCAVYLAPLSAEADFAELTMRSAAADNSLWAATVRTAVADDFGATEQVGRNQPCPCGSGKKFKHCHG